MTNNEINEYLAEHLFGLERNIDFGEIEHEWQQDFIGWSCKNCGEQSDEDPELSAFYGQETCYKQAPNYISNYQPILEELAAYGVIVIDGLRVAFKPDSELGNDIGKTYIDTSLDFIECDSVGLAICRAAVEYLKAKGGV